MGAVSAYVLCGRIFSTVVVSLAMLVITKRSQGAREQVYDCASGNSGYPL